MRAAAGVFISALSHVLLVALALFGTPKLFNGEAIQTIEVDIVRADEIQPPPEKPPEKPPDKSLDWNPLPQKSETQAQAATEKPAEKPTPPQQQKQPAPTQQALGPQTPSPPQPQQSPVPSIFDPSNIPALLNLPSAPDRDFDAEATTVANLSQDERTAFREHLKKCWKLPAGVAPNQNARVVMRVYLQRNGTLQGEPQLIEASASRDGPLIMQAAIRSLKECQPYAFMPVEKYREWRILELSFSPRDMAGG